MNMAVCKFSGDTVTFSGLLGKGANCGIVDEVEAEVILS